MRVRFAPSPTGPLHIGGVRTALYNYLLAKKHNGTFIVRIEDTDQKRFVEGAEEYIFKALEWCGISIDESPKHGGDYGPYRQSERKELYQEYINQLLQSGHAYKAFDTPEELDQKREKAKQEGNHSWQYDASTRLQMRNSISLTKEEVARLEQENVPFSIRFMMPTDQIVQFEDVVRGSVSFQTNVLDDKILCKPDGMPTYHMANVIDDHLMKITHVIRGEEWLSSTPLHVLLYQALNWQAPTFAHLPLLLKPEGQGKLSKRDGAKLGFPVFPLQWKDKEEEFAGFKEEGFIPSGLVNFLAMLGWNPGTEQELFSLEELSHSFSLEAVSQSGARFDYQKAKWFNQQHIAQLPIDELAIYLTKAWEKESVHLSGQQAQTMATLFHDRIELLADILEATHYLIHDISSYDEKTARKKYKPELRESFTELMNRYKTITWKAANIEEETKQFMADYSLGFGQVLPILRLSICGTMQGPSIFDVMEFLPQNTVINRLNKGLQVFAQLKENQ